VCGATVEEGDPGSGLKNVMSGVPKLGKIFLMETRKPTTV
jgi:hypothetical protein